MIEAEEARLNAIMKIVNSNTDKVAILDAPLSDGTVGSIALLEDDTTSATNMFNDISQRIIDE